MTSPTTATHWNYRPYVGSGLDEGWPMKDPIAAVRAFLEMYEHCGVYDIRDTIFEKGTAQVKLYGLANDSNGPNEDELNSDFDSVFWRPGDTWYRPTNETCTVKVSLSFRLVEGEA